MGGGDSCGKEFSIGLIFVACTRVHQLQDLLFSLPFPFHWLASLGNNCCLKEGKEDDHPLPPQNLANIDYGVRP